MLLNEYFTVIDREVNGDNTVFTIRMEKDHPVYQGHFPGNPVSPGVCNLQMIKECVEIVAGEKLTFTNISQYRLMEVVSPFRQQILKLSVAVKNSDAGFDVVASAYMGETPCITVKGSLVKK